MEQILNSEQKLAVETKSKNVIVAAGAGSGKTRVITERLKYLIANGANPRNIYAITYTNNAAQEMRERVGNTEVFIGTIHSLANRILLINGIDTSNFIEEEEFDELFSLIKEDSNVSLPVVDHLLIDEFQDICENEYEFIMEDLSPENFFACGDSCQSIYGFKGSNYKYFLRLVNDPLATVYELKSNYRCCREIIEYAEHFLSSIWDIYRINSKCTRGDIGCVYELTNTPDAIPSILSGANLKDWFVLCRTNSEVNDTINLLNKNNIPNTTFKKADMTNEEINNVLNDNVVKVLTIHSAKGLESKNVIVVGAKNWNAEELRICYVAATRARDNLYWLKQPPKKKPKPERLMSWG